MMARRTGLFALCVYAEGQRELAGQLGRHSVKVPDKFVGVAWEPGTVTGCPILAGTLGAVECRITSTMDAGDSVLMVAAVIAAYALAEGTPLTMARQDGNTRANGTTAACPPLLRQARIERITQGVADNDEREHRERDEQAGVERDAR